MNIFDLKNKLTNCRECRHLLKHEPRPVFQFSSKSRILIAGQAPGIRTHKSGKPFDDPSGERIMDWLGVSREEFYDENLFAIVPMSFCYPGTGKGGDLPPLKKCADIWREQVLSRLQSIRLTLLVGKYAQDWHLKSNKESLTSRVYNWQKNPVETVPLPHPSPRNNIWLSKNLWFEEQNLPRLKSLVRDALELS